MPFLFLASPFSPRKRVHAFSRVAEKGFHQGPKLVKAEKGGGKLK
jgi:hypothetical protein